MAEDSSEEILRYLDEHGIEDKDQNNSNLKKPRAQKRGTLHIERTVDLHGLRTGEAEIKIRASIKNCKESGIKKLIIIHGKGHHSDPYEGPVLKGIVESMLSFELKNLIQSFQEAPINKGGSGATVVNF